MNLAKAIELGKEAERSLREHKFHDHADAVGVLIEAGKLLQTLRMIPDFGIENPLPGETKD